MTELSSRLAGPEPELWHPNPGDIIEGHVVEMREIDGKYGPYPVVTLRHEDATETVVNAVHAALQSELKKQRVRIGDTLAIKYLGPVPGKSWLGYRVLVEHGRPDVTAAGSADLGERPFGGEGDDVNPSPAA